MKTLSQLSRSSTTKETEWRICPLEAQEILEGKEEVRGGMQYTVEQKKPAPPFLAAATTTRIEII